MMAFAAQNANQNEWVSECLCVTDALVKYAKNNNNNISKTQYNIKHKPSELWLETVI